MKEKANSSPQLRNYLLGKISSEGEKEKIEERLMLDDALFSELSLEEDEIIQEYVDGELSSDEQSAFEQNFLISEERREKIKFARALRKYIDEQKKRSESVSEIREKRGLKSILKSYILSPLPIAAGAALIVFASLLVWNFFIRVSDAQRAIALLNDAYKLERPLQSRVTQLGYAPFALRRGAAEAEFNVPQRNRAERILADETEAHPSAENLHSSARLSLLKKDFAEAVRQLETALELAPQNAEISSDLGAAYLEQGKTLLPKNKAKGLEMTGTALENLERAIEINPNLLEARFNKALALQVLMQPNQARQAWQEYLRLDSASAWADEARQNLKLLDAAQSSQSKTAAEILREFLTAYRNKDDESAYQILSRNREMITGKLIVQQLAFLFLKAETDADRSESLAALEYAGELERKKSGDLYVSETAEFYAVAPEKIRNNLNKAQIAIRTGYQFSLEGKHFEALGEFQNARETFARSDNKWEAALCDYWIGYSLFRLNKLEESTAVLKEAVERGAKYKWLAGQFYNWLATNMIASREYSKALDYNQKSLNSAEETFDLYNLQKTLAQRADIYRRLGDYRQALEFTQKTLESFNQSAVSLRQKWHGYDAAANLFYAKKLYRASASFESEALELAVGNLRDETFNYQSYVNLGLIRAALGKYDEALELFEKGRQIAENFSDEQLRKKSAAYTNLQTGHIRRQTENCGEALRYYDEALAFYDNEKLPLNQYAAHKGRLFCYFDNKDRAAFGAELPIILDLFRDHRQKILEEQNRNSFFDGEQSVYDTAIEYEFERGNFAAAFDYSEESRSRSLLDLQNSAVEVTEDDANPQIKFSASVTEPLKLVRLQAEMPENTQLLQYSVLEDKILIWFVTKSELSAAKADFSAEDLQKTVALYLDFLSKNDNSDINLEKRLAEKLYRILIAPVEEKLDSRKQICLIPDKSLFRLPFSTLVSPQTGKYFIAEKTFFLAPSANIFLNNSQKARKRAALSRENLLSIGNPSFDQENFKDLPDLISAEREAKEITSFYASSVLLTGNRATKEKINIELPSANVVHFAGHYVVNEHSPLLSGLILAANAQRHNPKDAVLSNREIVGEKLSNARLIVLSACQTGGETVYDGEGMIGAARAFLATGVPLVVGSHWSVDSNATAELMTRFHRYRKAENLPTVEALRRAQLDMLEGENKNFRRPFYWAAFIALGGYSEF